MYRIDVGVMIMNNEARVMMILISKVHCNKKYSLAKKD